MSGFGQFLQLLQAFSSKAFHQFVSFHIFQLSITVLSTIGCLVRLGPVSIVVFCIGRYVFDPSCPGSNIVFQSILGLCDMSVCSGSCCGCFENFPAMNSSHSIASMYVFVADLYSVHCHMPIFSRFFDYWCGRME